MECGLQICTWSIKYVLVRRGRWIHLCSQISNYNLCNNILECGLLVHFLHWIWLRIGHIWTFSHLHLFLNKLNSAQQDNSLIFDWIIIDNTVFLVDSVSRDDPNWIFFECSTFLVVITIFTGTQKITTPLLELKRSNPNVLCSSGAPQSLL